jgi:hypothetical protein
MIAALLNLARAEVNQHGHVLDATRQRLLAYGINAVKLEKYLAFTTEIE